MIWNSYNFMKLYHTLSNISFLRKSYSFKFLFIAFIGIHLPLIGIIFYVLYSPNAISPDSILIFTLLITLAATAVTLWMLNRLITPILFTSRYLDDYRKNRNSLELPTEYNDEVGLLMRNIQESIYESQKFLSEKQDMIFMLSHDLKNFAGNPRGLAQLIIDQKPSESIQELADLICQSTDLQLRYIDNFIMMLKEQDDIRNTSSDELKTFFLSSIIPLISEQVSQRLTDKNITLLPEVKVEEVNIKINQNLLVQVMVNLVTNAIKFSQRNSIVKIEIFKENKNLIIAVIDNGIGFSQNQSKELFKKFTNMSQLGTDNETSTGIGLYLCRKIIEKSGGTLIAASEGKNRGSVFKIMFQNVF